MTTVTNNKLNPEEKDLIDRIAEALPLEVRVEYYREMRYLHSLPESDEVLRIIRVMQFLTLLAERVPSQIAVEREHFVRINGEIIPTAKNLEKNMKEYYQLLQKQLTQLPTDIAEGISPKAIVERINDNLKKQFDLSTIPTIAKELATGAANIKTTAKEYTRASEELCGSWKSAANEAHRAIKEINAAITAAAVKAQRATEGIQTAITEATNTAEQATNSNSK